MTRTYRIQIRKEPYRQQETTTDLNAIPDLTKVMLKNFLEGDPQFGEFEIYFTYEDTK